LDPPQQQQEMVITKDNDQGNEQKEIEQKSRRDFLKGSVAAAGAGIAATTVPGVTAAAEGDCQPENPYGARPGGGISLPEYYKPWPAIKNRNMYLPGTEILPKNEMRITFLGSSPWPPNPLQKGTSMLVELGNGTAQPRRFFNGPVSPSIRVRCSKPAGSRLTMSKSLPWQGACKRSTDDLPLFLPGDQHD